MRYYVIDNLFKHPKTHQTRIFASAPHDTEELKCSNQSIFTLHLVYKVVKGVHTCYMHTSQLIATWFSVNWTMMTDKEAAMLKGK